MTNNKLKIIFFGTPDFINPVLETLKKNFEVVGIITSSNNSTIEQLNNLNPDLFVVAAYGKLISKELLDIPKYGSLNIHPSLLPKYRGASPVPSAILNGDEATGLTIIKMDEEMDHGPILYQKEFPVSSIDTFIELVSKLFAQSAKILPKIIEDFTQGKIELKEQSHTEATFCKPLEKQSGYFEIDSPPTPEKLDRMIRAYYPWPTAWTKWNGKIVKFLPNPVVIAKQDQRSVIAIRQLAEKQSLSNNKYLLQMEGKKPATLKDFLNGYPDFPIKTL